MPLSKDFNISPQLLGDIDEMTSRLKYIAVVYFSTFLITFLYNPFTNKLGLTTSLSVYVFKLISKSSNGVQMIAISPFEAILTDLKVAALLAFVITLPYITWHLIRFLSPGLMKHEKRIAYVAIAPATGLFIIGAAFMWFLIIPIMFKFTKVLDVAMGIAPTVSVSSFTTILLSMVVAMGLAFETPIIMATVVYLNITTTAYLATNWRYAVAGSFVIALFISPGATGGMMESIIGCTLSGLYGLGLFVSKMIETSTKSVITNAAV